jgi:hypothetical protein
MKSRCSRGVERAEKPINTEEKNGRRDWTRTSDLYRVKVEVQQPVIDSKGVNNRRNRQNRNTRRNLLPNCYQNMQVGSGLNRGGSAPLRPESCWNDCLKEGEKEKGKKTTIRPCVPSQVAYEVGAGRQQTVRSPRTMYPYPQG